MSRNKPQDNAVEAQTAPAEEKPELATVKVVCVKQTFANGLVLKLEFKTDEVELPYATAEALQQLEMVKIHD